MILQQKRKKKKRNCSAISTTGNIIAGAMPSLSPEPKDGEAGNVRKQIHTDPIVVPVAKGLVDLGIQGVSLKGKTQNKSGKQVIQKLWGFSKNECVSVVDKVSKGEI